MTLSPACGICSGGYTTPRPLLVHHTLPSYMRCTVCFTQDLFQSFGTDSPESRVRTTLLNRYRDVNQHVLSILDTQLNYLHNELQTLAPTSPLVTELKDLSTEKKKVEEKIQWACYQAIVTSQDAQYTPVLFSFLSKALPKVKKAENLLCPSLHKTHSTELRQTTIQEEVQAVSRLDSDISHSA